MKWLSWLFPKKQQPEPENPPEPVPVAAPIKSIVQRIIDVRNGYYSYKGNPPTMVYLSIGPYEELREHLSKYPYFGAGTNIGCMDFEYYYSMFWKESGPGRYRLTFEYMVIVPLTKRRGEDVIYVG